MPINFYVIIASQLIVFLGFYCDYRSSVSNLSKLLLISAMFGLVFGVLFDVVFGTLRMYNYSADPYSVTLAPWGLSPLQLVFTGVFSFGLAVATAYFFLPKKYPEEKPLNKKILTILSVLKIVAASIIVVFVDPGILALFACGVIVLILGELIMILRSKSGPFLSFLLYQDTRSFIKLWFQVMIVGLLYEIVNTFFPFWVWLPGLEYSYVLIESLIIVFGYMVVIHPMIIFWQIMKDKKYVS